MTAASQPDLIRAERGETRLTPEQQAEKETYRARLRAFLEDPGEVPSYDVHVGPLTKRYCVSCHRAGKQNNNYLLTSYDEMLNTGDNAPVVTAGDPQSLLLQLITGHEGIDPKTGNTIRQMPPTKLLDQQYIDMLTRWVLAGMPQTAEEAAKANP